MSYIRRARSSPPRLGDAWARPFPPQTEARDAAPIVSLHPSHPASRSAIARCLRRAPHGAHDRCTPIKIAPYVVNLTVLPPDPAPAFSLAIDPADLAGSFSFREPLARGNDNGRN